MVVVTTIVRQLQDLLQLVRHSAASASRELVRTQWASALGIERHRLTNYLGLLETAYLITEVPAWVPEAARRTRRHPKLMLVDPGLASHIVGVDAAGLAATVSPMRGALVETFAHGQLQRALAWSRTRARLNHWRDHRGREVDLVLETRTVASSASR